MIGLMVPSAFAEGNLDKLIPEKYSPYDEQYSITESPNPGENPYIESYNSFTNEQGVYAAIIIFKYSSNDIAKQKSE